MTSLIISEKPSTAQKIAEALADKMPEKHVYLKRIPYYELTHNGEKIIVACAVGHLYSVAEKDKKGWSYPVFSMEWKPAFDVAKGSAFTKPYLQLIKKLSSEADKFIVACDYDIEGEVIGFNIIRFACGKKDALRMKFSTTTKEDLRKSYDHIMKHMDHGQAEAGITRHELDWLFGINLSRALTLSIKHATGMFKILSSGRVQGPALKLLTEREKEIQVFVSVPYWELELVCQEISAFHKHGKFPERKSPEAIVEKCQGKPAIVEKVERKQFQQAPPHPFDLTALQLEAYRVLHIQPKETLELAQNLYINSYISYPRTSSNQLSPVIGYRKVLEKLSHQDSYTTLCGNLLARKELQPYNGKKKDAAHPAIYPTGEAPKSLTEREVKLYDLIVRRFLATFADPAVRETAQITIDIGLEKFTTSGTHTIKENWHAFYKPYVKLEEEDVHVEEKQTLQVKQLNIHDKETQPPKRYTPASVIKELEKKNLGTKATRSDIIEGLFDRNYIRGRDSLEVTGLGMATIEVLIKYCPEILDEQLTRDFEDEMEKIQQGQRSESDALKHAEVFLTDVLGKFKEHEKEIGSALSGSYKETMREEVFVMKCECSGDLQIRYTPKFKSYFIACSKYPECKKSFSLPRGYLAKTSGKMCDACTFPEVLLISRGKRPWAFCINQNCPKKAEYRARMEEKKTQI
ncbi:MAG TPA: DNA topoisomerase I [Candidatus Nanoarchaeia archaeon]|nr:DNA topoisomerase I [Candidatus Nanoarchaeia archaeon]